MTKFNVEKALGGLSRVQCLKFDRKPEHVGSRILEGLEFQA